MKKPSPPVSPRRPSRSLIHGHLEALNNNSELFVLFLTDMDRAADTRREIAIADLKGTIRTELETHFKRDKNIDMRSIRRAATEMKRRDPYLERFEEKITKREKDFIEEYRVVSCSAAIVSLSRQALGEVLANKPKYKKPEELENILNVYTITKTLLQKSLGRHLSTKVEEDISHGKTVMETPFKSINLVELETLVIWLSEFLSRELTTFQRHISTTYEAEKNKESEDWMSKVLDILDRQFRTAILFFETYFSRKPTLSLPSPSKMYTRPLNSFDIANTRMEHLSILFALMLKWMVEHPGSPIGLEIHSLVAQYRDRSSVPPDQR